MEKMITITKSDYQQLKTMVFQERRKLQEALWNLDLFESVIANSDKVESEAITSNFVTMGSKVKVYDMETGKTRIVEVTYPQDSDSRNFKVSVLSDLGTAILGHSIGTMIYYNSSVGKKKMRIDEILFQPEAYGVYNDNFRY
jgi:regulator of nucleoside diphosphate kinase